MFWGQVMEMWRNGRELSLSHFFFCAYGIILTGEDGCGDLGSNFVRSCELEKRILFHELSVIMFYQLALCRQLFLQLWYRVPPVMLWITLVNFMTLYPSLKIARGNQRVDDCDKLFSILHMCILCLFSSIFDFKKKETKLIPLCETVFEICLLLINNSMHVLHYSFILVENN